ncbi:MAG: hypothetical protein RLY86_1450 [Pseudomonadota bacterium]|jgi:hypothetical protein
MQWFILGAALLVVTALLVQGFMATDPKVLARWLRRLGIALALVVVGVLVWRGLLGPLLFLLPLLIPLAMRWRSLWNRAKAMAGPTPGQTSNVETAALRMWLDHDTGAMDGEVLLGPETGKHLSDLPLDRLLELLVDLPAADPQARPLLEAYLDRTWPDWRGPAGAADGAGEGGGESTGTGPRTGGAMTREEALEILGLTAEAGEEEIRQAHRRLMLRNHPDQGGSTYIAAQLNQAKDILLGRRRRPG